MINIAIDGPAGAGKSTIAQAIAKELGYIYVDTGALYRAIGLSFINKGVDMNDEQAVALLLAGTSIEIRFINMEQHVFLNDSDVTGKIRTEAVSMAASACSALPAVRAFLLQLQRDLAADNNVVMDGRDIGTVILPNAQIKIFLTATPEDRAQRRYEELIGKGVHCDYESVYKDLIRRDYDDSHREVAPLRPAEGAIILDTTGNPLEVSIELLIGVVKKRLEELNA